MKHIEFHRKGSMSSIVGGGWTKEEDKAFENGIAKYWADDSKSNRWEKIASMVPSKTIAELKQHYETLLEDIVAIESGEVPLPCYLEDEMTTSVVKNQEKRPSVYSYESMFSPRSQGSKAGLKSDPERRKGIPWTEEEHRLFLLGLDKFGKGDWRSISRNFVISRTPTQVASHAQKYFVRLTSMNRDRRRSSIHDITSINNGDVSLPSSQGPITGQQANANPSGAVNFRPAPKHFPGPTGHSMMAAIGTPVIIPPGLHPPYVPVAYPVPPQMVHQP